MKVEWDYTELAEAYLKRPEYSQKAIDKMVNTANLGEGAVVCDVGAGAAHLTLMLARKGYNICAVEPNDAMRSNGIAKTQAYNRVKWFEGVGEDTKMADKQFDLVTFGSSFNVCDRPVALKESARILKEGGWFACMWNHRDLHDPLQVEIEAVIKQNIPEYDYGTRREDQTEIIEQSGLFKDVLRLSGSIIVELSVEDFIDGWKSHGTLQRQSKELFEKVVKEIGEVVKATGGETVKVPYTTNIWMAQKK